jgi:uracil-DNA glycosylase
VKCSPRDGGRGSAKSAMAANCPPRYLLKELEILKPRVVLVVGKQTWWSVAGALKVSPPADGAAARGSSNVLKGRRLEVFFVVHPAAKEYAGSVRRFAGLR